VPAWECLRRFQEQGESSMKASIAALSVVSFFSAILLSSPALSQSQRPLCPSIFGKSMKVSGVIQSVSVSNGAAQYDLGDADSPCASLYFSVVDPRGTLLCKVGQRISASGTVVDNGLGANLSSTDYTCQ
jgi:hypothetical protein